MRGTSINDEENLARFSYQKSLEELNKDIRVYPAGCLNHEPHAAFRGDRGNQAHGVAGTRGYDDRGLTFLTPGASRVMIGSDMRCIAEINVGSLRFGHLLDLRVFRFQPFPYQRAIALRRPVQRFLR